MNKTILAVTMIPLFLSACGGEGGSSEDPAPSANTAPQASAVKIQDNNAAAPELGDLLSGSYQFSDKDGDAEGNSTFRWLRNGDVIVGATGKSYTLTEADLGAELTFEVTPVAAAGVQTGTAERSPVFAIPANSAPSFSALSFNQNTAIPGEQLVIQLSYQDSENDAAGDHIFRWFRNGTEINGATAATYTVTSVDVGQKLTAKVTAVATTGIARGAEQDVSDAVSVQAPNQAPTVSQVVITDNNGGKVTSGDALKLSYLYADAENDAEASADIVWRYKKDGVTADLPAASGKTDYVVTEQLVGATIWAEIAPRALTGTLAGSAVSSNQLQVFANAAPSFNNLAFNKTQASSGDTITIGFDYSDAENDAQGAHIFRWYRNGNQISEATAASYTLSDMDAASSITATAIAVAASGTQQGEVQRVSSGNAVTVAALNEAPTVSDIKIQWHSSTQLAPGTYLSGSYQYNDKENDPESGTSFRWLRDGVAISGATFKGYTIKDEDRGKELTFEVTPKASAGTANGVATIGQTVEVLTNRAPTAANVVITDGNGGELKPGDTLTVSYDYNDVEGDPEGETNIAWQYRLNNASGYIPRAGGGSTYVVSSAYVGGEIWAVVTPKAKTGVFNGKFVQSNSLNVVAKQAPTASDIRLLDQNGGDVVVGDILTASYSYNDADGDAESGTILRWYSDDVLLETPPGNNYTVRTQDAGKQIKFSVIPKSVAGETGASYTSRGVSVVNQALSFSLSGDQKVLTNVWFNNPARGLGDGKISYSSSDADVVVVSNGETAKHPAGEIYPKKVGTATITATIAETADHPAASASYEVEVRASSMKINGWVGAQGSELWFNTNQSGMLMHSTSDADCNWMVPSGCLGYQSTELQDYSSTSEKISDSALTLSRAGHYRVDYGNYQARAQLSSTPYYGHSLGAHFIEFKGKFWRIGGDGFPGDGNNEIWSSDDGRVWQQETTDVSRIFTPRYDHHVIEFQGRLWLTGGTRHIEGRVVPQMDIWSSDDGIHWTENTSFADFGRHSDHTVVVANDKMWLSGGNATNQNELWSSEDGLRWSKHNITQACGISLQHRFEMGVVVGKGDEEDKLICHSEGKIYQLNGSSWIESGTTGDFFTNQKTGSYSRFVQLNDQLLLIDPINGWVYGRTDTGSWSQYSAGADPRKLTTAGAADIALFNGKIHVMASQSGRIRSQSSADGFYWLKDGDSFGGRYNSAAVLSNNKIVMVGGITGGFATDTWQSSNGIGWQKRKMSNGVASKNTLSAVHFNDQIWVVQDNGAVARLDEAGDTSRWTVTASSADGDFPEMRFARLVVHNNKLTLIAKHEIRALGSSVFYNRIYTSENGTDWTDLGAGQGELYSSDFLYSAFSFNGSLWVVGGAKYPANHQGKIWQSADGGETWVETLAPFSPRSEPRIVEFNGELWMYGGFADKVRYNDVWKSSNGTDWTRVTENTTFSTRIYPAMVAHGDRMLLLGGLGDNNERYEEIWSTEDGINWEKAIETQIEFNPEPVEQR